MSLHHPTRRRLIGGLGLLIAAPAVVRISNLMPVRIVAQRFPLVYRSTLMVGFNDIDPYASEATVVAELEALIDTIAANNSGIVIVGGMI